MAEEVLVNVCLPTSASKMQSESGSTNNDYNSYRHRVLFVLCELFVTSRC